MTELLRIKQDDDGISISGIDEPADSDTLAEEFAKINTRAFSLAKQTSLAEARNKLDETDLYIRAYRTDKIVGFALYQLIPSNLGSIIYQARGILPEAQGMGLGRAFPQAAVKVLQPSHFIAKAQNPISIWSTMQSGVIDKTYPIEESFQASDEMRQLLLDTVLARGKGGEVDMSTGLHRSSYPMGRLGDYYPEQNHPGIMAVTQRLASIGMDALNGDAVYYGGRVNEDAKRIM